RNAIAKFFLFIHYVGAEIEFIFFGSSQFKPWACSHKPSKFYFRNFVVLCLRKNFPSNSWVKTVIITKVGDTAIFKFISFNVLELNVIFQQNQMLVHFILYMNVAAK